MYEVTPLRFASAAVMMPLIIPVVLMLIPRWRYSRRTMYVIAAAAELGMIAMALLIGWLLGFTVFSVWMAGVLMPAVCIAAFIFCTDLRDGRLVFSVMTIALDTSLCDTFASFFSVRGEPLWLGIKIAISLIQCVVIWRFCRRPLQEMLCGDQIKWGPIALIPLTLCVTLVGYHLAPVVGSDGRLLSYPQVLLSIASVLMYVTLYRFQRAMVAQAEAEQHAVLLRSQIDFLYRQTAAAESANENMRVFRHDIRHYICLLRSSQESGDLGTIGALLDRMEKNTDASVVRGALRDYTGDALLDTVLTQAAVKAEQEGLEYRVRLTLPGELRFDRAEFAVVVSNVLENAINAALREPADAPRVVSVKSEIRGGQFLMVVSNTFTAQLRLDEESGLPCTSEPGHGYGMHSIAEFAQKYGALVNCSIKDGVFSLRLLI